MSPISKVQKRFSDRLDNPRVLSNPEEFLGPNYRAVLDFWLILDELTGDQWDTIWRRSRDFYYNHNSEWHKITDEAIEALSASNETIGRELANNATDAAWNVYGWVADYTTRELIGMHKLFQKDQSLKIFPLFYQP